MTAPTLLFALIFFTGFIALCIFARRFIEANSPRDIVGIAFGAALMLTAVLIIPGAG